MEQFFGTPTTIIGWIGTLIVIIGGFSYYWRQKRNEDLKTLRDTNRDQGDRISVLEKSVENQKASIDQLQGKVQLLELKNKTLEDMVTVALKNYFFEHPDLAKSMQEKILG